MENQYEKHMHECLRLAEIALQAGDPPVGCIIVFEDEIIGSGIESGKSTGDITNHAEILAVKDAIKNGYRDQLKSSKMITTHEPCIMCSYVIRHHRIPEIIFGISVPSVGGATSEFNVLTSESVNSWGASPKITQGVCKSECETLDNLFRNK